MFDDEEDDAVDDDEEAGEEESEDATSHPTLVYTSERPDGTGLVVCQAPRT